MKELWSPALWFILFSVTQTRCKHLRARPSLSDTHNYKRKLEYKYPYQMGGYYRYLTEGERYVRANMGHVSADAPGRNKRENGDTEHKRKVGQKVSHDSTLLPQPAKPLRVVATSAVIKNRRKKPRPLKAIHIWGPTPFKTVLENLRRLNDNIQKQRGAVKRLFLPVQLQRMQLLNALGKPPLPGPIPGPFPHQFPTLNPNRQFSVSPAAIHLQEEQPPLPHVPDPMRFAPPELSVPPEPVPPFHDMDPMRLQEPDPVHDFPPAREVSPVQDIAPVHEMEPDQVMNRMRDIEPVQETSPMQETGGAREMSPIPENGPVPQLFPKSFDIIPNIAPNVEPPNGMFVPPFPWMAGEIHEEVNRHINKGG